MSQLEELAAGNLHGEVCEGGVSGASQYRISSTRRSAGPPFPLQLLRAFGPWGVDREESRIRAGKLSEEIDGANCDETQHYQEKSQGESGHQAL